MGEDPKDEDAEIQEILSDLDAILSETEEVPKAAAKPPEPHPEPKPQPKLQPTPQPKSAEPPPAPATGGLKIELPPREGMAPLPAKSAPAPIHVPAPAPAPAPSPFVGGAAVSGPAQGAPPGAAAPKPSPASPAKPPIMAEGGKPLAAPVETGHIPEKTPKEQIRRVAILYATAWREHKDRFLVFLDQSALTISKKPLYLRRVVVEELGAVFDAKALLQKVQAAKAVAVLALVEGVPDAKVRDLQDTFSCAGLSFRSVAPADVQKRSTAVDIMVDMMLLSPEA